MTEPPPSAETPPTPAIAGWRTLPRVRTGLTPSEVLARLEHAARRGSLPGFRAWGTSGFALAVFGEPFDRELRATMTRVDELGPAGSTTVSFQAPLVPKLPLIFGAVLGVSVWPGVWLTDSMLRTYFPSYTFPTWVWYLPLTVLPVLWAAPRMIRKSEASCRVSAAEQIAKVAAAVGGEVES